MSWDILPKGNLQYFLQKLKAKFDLKVDKEAGKGLFSGSYNDLSDKPTIPAAANNNTITIQLNGTTIESFTLNQDTDETINIQVTKSDVGLGNVPNVSTNDQTPTFTQASTRANIASGEKLSVIFGKIMKWFADLKTVAFSGSYTDLSNTPTIPSAANNGTLTIKQNGTSKGTFTANQSGNSTVELTDTTYESKTAANGGTAVSLVTTGEKYTWNNKSNFSGSYNDLSNKPTIPAAVAVKGNAESAYRTGNVNITPANIGLGNVNNTADANKSVNYATSAGSAGYANKALVEGENSGAYISVQAEGTTVIDSEHDSHYYFPSCKAVTSYLNSNLTPIITGTTASNSNANNIAYPDGKSKSNFYPLCVGFYRNAAWLFYSPAYELTLTNSNIGLTLNNGFEYLRGIPFVIMYR